MTVSGAYGRDYKSLKAAKLDWEAGKDFITRGYPTDGQYINKPQITEPVYVRYQQDRKQGRLQ